MTMIYSSPELVTLTVCSPVSVHGEASFIETVSPAAIVVSVCGDCVVVAVCDLAGLSSFGGSWRGDR